MKELCEIMERNQSGDYRAFIQDDERRIFNQHSANQFEDEDCTLYYALDEEIPTPETEDEE